jgi:hypothetical protein
LTVLLEIRPLVQRRKLDFECLMNGRFFSKSKHFH